MFVFPVDKFLNVLLLFMLVGINSIICPNIPCDIPPFFECECRIIDKPFSSITQFSQVCPLVWKFMSSGDELPGKGIQPEPGSHLFSVRVSRNGRFHVGAYDVVNRKAHFVNSQNETDNADSFEILTNPHNCTLHWQEFIVGSTNEHKPKFTVSISNEVYMARFFNEEDESWIPGHITITGNSISSFGYVYGPVRNVTYPQILQSYSDGLELEMSNIVLAKENLFDVTGRDFMGIDEIRNEGSGVVELELSHFKQTVRHYGFTFNANISASVLIKISLKVPIDLPIPGCKYDENCEIEILYCDLGPTFLPNLFQRTETVDMKVTRKVTIPPYAHVESCSIVKYIHNVDIDFTARGKYQIKGWTGEEVSSLLAKEGVVFNNVAENYVTLDMSGKYSFSLALNTKFFIGAFDTFPCWNLGTRNGITGFENITKNVILIPE